MDFASSTRAGVARLTQEPTVPGSTSGYILSFLLSLIQEVPNVVRLTDHRCLPWPLNSKNTTTTTRSAKKKKKKTG